MYNIVSTFLFAMLTFCLQAQSLTIANGTDQISFPLNSYYEVFVTQDNDCCDGATLEGKITRVTTDSLQFFLRNYDRFIAFDQTISENHFSQSPISSTGWIAKKDVYSLKNYASPKKKRQKEIFTGIGGVLMLTGIATAAHYFAPNNKTSRKRLLISGGIQAGVSLGFLIAGAKKEYEFKGDGAIWEIK